MRKLKLTKEQLERLLFDKKCFLCNGDVVLNVEFNKELLLITFHTNCKKCDCYFKHLLYCESIEQLEQAQFEILKSTLEAKGYI